MVKDKEKGFSVDMTDAAVIEPLPTDKPYLAAFSAWALSDSKAGAKMVKFELTIKEPKEYGKRKIFENVSLENEFTKGRLQQLFVKGLEWDIAKVRTKNFVLPSEDDMLGQEVTVFVNIQAASGAYGESNRVRRFAPASTYAELAAGKGY